MWKSYKKIYLEKYFHKNIHIPLFDKYFFKTKESKLCFGDRFAVKTTLFLNNEGVWDNTLVDNNLNQYTQENPASCAIFPV